MIEGQMMTLHVIVVVVFADDYLNINLLALLGRVGSGPGDDVGGGHLAGQEVLHIVHIGGDVAKKHLVAGAEGVQAGLDPNSASTIKV